MMLKYSLNKNTISARAVRRGCVAVIAAIFVGFILYRGGTMQLLSIKPAAYMAWYKGNAAFDEGDFGQAEIYYVKALNGNVKAAGISYNLGNAYYSQGRYKEAITAYKNALTGSNARQQAAAWNNLGNAYYMAGNLEESEAAYRHALLFADGDNGIRQNFVYVSSKIEQKNEREMIVQFKKSTDANNDNQPGKKGNKDDAKGGESKGERSNQNNNLSTKTVNDLLSQISQDENNLRGRISKSKLNNEQAATGPDY